MSRTSLQTPIISGNQATFLWFGKQAPGLVGDFNQWDIHNAMAFSRERKGRWTLTVSLPKDAYVEYAFVIDGEWVTDPHNPRRVHNGYGGYNHFFYMPEARPTPLARRRPSGPHGTLTRLWAPTPGNATNRRRRLLLYQPASRVPVPLLVVFDGIDYYRRASLVNLVDNLIAENRMKPVALAMLANGGPARNLEYSCNDAMLEFLTTDLLPLAANELDLIDLQQRPGVYGVLGASLGGLMALYCGLRLPHIFGSVLSQAGAFEAQFVVNDLVSYLNVQPIKIWMDVGVLDELQADNQRMYQLLKSKGYPVTLTSFSGGHNYSAWREDVWRGLEAMYG